MSRVLICGGGGFIGGYLAKQLLTDGHDVKVADLKPKADWWQWHENARNYQGCNLRSYDNCRQVCAGVDEVYQLAAQMGGAGIVFSGDYDAEIMHDSAQINLNIAELARLNKFRLFYSSSACFPSGTLVATSRGSIPIEQIVVGDRVVTGTGAIRAVTKVFARAFAGTLAIVQLKGTPSIAVTSDHLFLTSDGQWTPASELAGHSVVLPQPDLIALPDEFEMHPHKLMRLRKALKTATVPP